MPYVRLYSRPLPLEQKRVIAQKLIDITLRTFRLRPVDRYQTSIQFITLPEGCAAKVWQPSIEGPSDFTLELLGHHLTEEKKRAFAREAVKMLADVVRPPGPLNRIARVFGRKAGRPCPVELRFQELYPAISEPYVVYSDRLAA